MPTDDDLRRLERAAAAAPDDAAGWLLLATACERAGRRREAARAVVRAHRLAPDDPERARRLAEVGRADGLWPCERGDGRNSQSSPMHGPDAGVMRWRVALPRDVSGRSLVDAVGRIYLRASSALLVVDPDGRRTDAVEWPMPAPSRAVLVQGEPRVFDVASSTLIGPDVQMHFPAAPMGVGACGLALGGSRRDLVALGAGGVHRWRRSLDPPHRCDLAVSSGEAVVALLDRRPARAPAVKVMALGLEAGESRWTWGGDGPPAAPREAYTADDVVIGDASGVGPATVAVGEAEVVVRLCDDRAPAWIDGARVSRALVVVEVATGARRWLRKLDSPSAPALHAGRVVVSTDRAVHDLDLATGEPRWRLDVRGANPPTLDGRGVAYLSTGEGQLLAVGPGGDVRWRLQVPGVGRLGPVSLGDDGWAYATFGRDLIALR